MEKGEKITLCVKKRTPSLNTLLGMNRWARVKEKREMQKATMIAIEYALSPGESESTKEISVSPSPSNTPAGSLLNKKFPVVVAPVVIVLPYRSPPPTGIVRITRYPNLRLPSSSSKIYFISCVGYIKLFCYRLSTFRKLFTCQM